MALKTSLGSEFFQYFNEHLSCEIELRPIQTLNIFPVKMNFSRIKPEHLSCENELRQNQTRTSFL